MKNAYKVVISSQYEEVKDVTVTVKASTKYEAIHLATQEKYNEYLNVNGVNIEDDSVLIHAVLENPSE
jgi:hypothetical protein